MNAPADDDLKTVVREFRASFSAELAATNQRMAELADEVRTRLMTFEQALFNALRDLRHDMDLGFARVDDRFDDMDARFEQVDARFEQVDARFEQVDARFEQVDARFEQVDARFEQVEQRLDRIEGSLGA